MPQNDPVDAVIEQHFGGNFARESTTFGKPTILS